MRSKDKAGGFWLRPSEGSAQRQWVILGGHGSGSAAEPLQGTLEELLVAAAATTEALKGCSTDLTDKDWEELASYGGQRTTDVKEYEAQFRVKGLQARSMSGAALRKFYVGTLLGVLLAWAGATAYCSIRVWQTAQAQARHPSGAAELLMTPQLVGESVELRLPRPWFLPTQLSCSADGEQLALGDGVRVFASSGEAWRGPLRGCDASDVTAFSLSSGGHVHAATEGSRAIVRMGVPADCGQPQAGPELRAFALEVGPGFGGAGTLAGIAVRAADGVLLAMEGDEAVGELAAPGGRKWVAVAMREGRAWALDADGDVFVMDASRSWSGPLPLQRDGVRLVDLCGLAGGGIMALGHRQNASGASAELWRFESPPP